MKKSILFLAFVMITGVTTLATADDNRSSEQTRKLAQKLELNESAYIKVKQINDLKFQELDKVAGMYANDAALKQAKFSEIENNFNRQIEGVLNNNQKIAFQNYLAQSTANIAITK